MQGINRNEISKDNWTVSDPTEQPTDTVSSISWSKTRSVPTFATGSWDSHIRIYEVDTEKKSLARTACFEAGSPCLGVDWHEDGIQVFAGCASGDIKGFSSSKSKGFDIGSHNGPVKDVHWVADLNVLCSVSFDKTVKLWDLRQADPVYKCELKYKPISSDVHGSKLALALNEYRAAVIDLAEALRTQSSQEGLRYMETPLRTNDPFSCVKFLPDGERVAFGTAGGRSNISKIERDDPQGIRIANIMTFKAHLTKADPHSNTPNRLFPVNSILVNSKKTKNFYGTCGGEGKIYYWDYIEKNEICKFQMKDSVTCGKMSWDGNLLAFATGYDWSRGISGSMTKHSEVSVRVVNEGELVYGRR